MGGEGQLVGAEKPHNVRVQPRIELEPFGQGLADVQFAKKLVKRTRSKAMDAPSEEAQTFVWNLRKALRLGHNLVSRFHPG
jgi:hypothetical protein